MIRFVRSHQNSYQILSHPYDYFSLASTSRYFQSGYSLSKLPTNAGGALVDMTSNQNAPSTKMVIMIG
jgi:hypothetical protein